MKDMAASEEPFLDMLKDANGVWASEKPFEEEMSVRARIFVLFFPPSAREVFTARAHRGD